MIVFLNITVFIYAFLIKQNLVLAKRFRSKTFANC